MYVTFLNRWDLPSCLFCRLPVCIRFTFCVFVSGTDRSFHIKLELTIEFLFSDLPFSFHPFTLALRRYTGQDRMHIYIFRMSIQPLSFCHLFFSSSYLHSSSSPLIHLSVHTPFFLCHLLLVSSCSHIPALPPSSASGVAADLSSLIIHSLSIPHFNVHRTIYSASYLRISSHLTYHHYRHHACTFRRHPQEAHHLLPPFHSQSLSMFPFVVLIASSSSIHLPRSLCLFSIFGLSFPFLSSCPVLRLVRLPFGFVSSA